MTPSCHSNSQLCECLPCFLRPCYLQYSVCPKKYVFFSGKTTVPVFLANKHDTLLLLLLSSALGFVVRLISCFHAAAHTHNMHRLRVQLRRRHGVGSGSAYVRDRDCCYRPGSVGVSHAQYFSGHDLRQEPPSASNWRSQAADGLWRYPIAYKCQPRRLSRWQFRGLSGRGGLREQAPRRLK